MVNGHSLKERTALYKRFRRAFPGLERTSESYTVLPFNILFSRESPPAIPAKIDARRAMILVACHLHPRSGTSQTEELVDKAQARKVKLTFSQMESCSYVLLASCLPRPSLEY